MSVAAGTLRTVGLITDYFLAASDAAAAQHLDTGVYDVGLDPADVLEAKGVDPFVMLGTLESMLTPVAYETISADPTPPVAMGESGEHGVARVRGTLTSALAGLTPERVPEVAAAWGRTEEFGDDPDEAGPAGFLADLTALARRATAQDRHLYCWFSV